MEKKILFILKRPGIGGVQTYAKILADYLNQTKKYKCSIYFYYPDFYALLDSFKGFEIYTLSKKWFSNTLINRFDQLFNFMGVKQKLIAWHFKSIIKKRKIDIIHLNTDVADGLFNILKQYQIPTLLTLHGIYKIKPHEMTENEWKKKISGVFQICDHIAYFSQDNLKSFEEILDDKYSDSFFTKIINPYQKGKSVPVSVTGAMKFCLIGRGFKEKGWEEALEVFKNLTNQSYSFELHFYGEGAYLEELCAAHKDLDWFYFHGSTNNPQAVITQYHVGLLPTYHDEMPFTIIEFLSVGIPVIATDVGAIRDMITDVQGRRAGQLIDLTEGKPNIEALAQSIERYLRSPALREEHSKRAMLAFNKFDIENIGVQFEQLFDSLCE